MLDAIVITSGAVFWYVAIAVGAGVIYGLIVALKGPRLPDSIPPMTITPPDSYSPERLEELLREAYERAGVRYERPATGAQLPLPNPIQCERA